MIVDQKTIISAPVEKVWTFLNDIPAVSTCMPGVEEFEPLDENTFQGAIKVRVGPIGVRLQGKIVVAERDEANHRSRLDIQATERRINSTVSARATMTLTPVSEAQTELHVLTEASILGKLGEFGQAVMRRKADQMLDEFVRNMSKAIGAA
jgi:carbon monoxide dehydrogenase subunit G